MSSFRLQNSIFGRLVLLFLVIMIPIYALGVYIYSWGLQTIKQEIFKSTVSQASFYLQGLEKEIERIRILQYDCLNDENLNRLALRWDVLDKYARAESIRQLQQRLISLKNSSLYIKNVSAYIQPIQQTVSANDVLNDIDMDKFDNIRASVGITGAQLINYKGGLYLSTLLKSNLAFNNSLYMVEVELDQDQLRSALEHFSTYESSGSLLVQNDSIIAAYGSDDTIHSIESMLKSASLCGDNGITPARSGRKNLFVVYVKSAYLDMTLVRYIPEQIILQPLSNFPVWVWVFSLATGSILLVFSVVAYKYMHKPMRELVESFHKLELGDTRVSIDHDSKNEFSYLYKRFNEMVRKLNTLIEQVYKQKILMQRAELKQLQSQINPHFLYNSFFILNTMARINGDDNMILFTKHLGEYFRFLTRNASDFIALSEELNHARTYTSIQMMRFPKRLRVSFADCPLEYINSKVPRLILQPILENAFEHGIEDMKELGIINVSFVPGESKLDIVIEDNGAGISHDTLSKLQESLNQPHDDVETAEITGIINIHRRIRLIYGSQSGLSFSKSALGGLRVQVMLDFKGGQNNV